jgi:hypothetical protein
MTTTTTAWWGFCYHCSSWFNSHNTSCPTLMRLVPSTSANPIVWPVTPVTTTVAAQSFLVDSNSANRWDEWRY